MKMRRWGLVALLALVPAALAAQEPKQDSVAPPQVKKAPAMRILRLTDRDVQRALPQMRAELSGSMPEDNAMNAMTRTEYIKVKNALMIGRLDFRDESRLQSAADDGSLDVRRMNASFYRLNESRLEPLVQRMAPDRTCKQLCGQ